MKSRRGILAAALVAVGVFLALAAGAAELKEGRDFRLINPSLPAPKDRIEVTEFFWYGCPHCFDFEPVLAAWARKLPVDVTFRRVPTVTPSNKWTSAAQLYYTLEALGLIDKLHSDVFNAIHVDYLRLDDEQVALDWVEKKGVDRKKFSEAWSSSGVQARIQQARELSRASGLTGVPAVMVQGRYLALTADNYEELLGNIEQLIKRARAEAGGK